MQRFGWRSALPALALAATLGATACGGRDDNDIARNSNGDSTAADASRQDADQAGSMAGDAAAQNEARADNARGMQISLVGCVQRSAPGSSRYLLTQVRTAGQGDADATVGTSGSTGSESVPSAAGDQYELVAGSDQQLGDHVGRRVKVQGRLASDTVGTSGAGEPGATGTGGAMAPSASTQTFYVSDVTRVGTDVCTASNPRGGE